MTQNKAYVNLQRHLDNQPVGFPATKSGVELKLLKHIFTPLEAELAACLTYKFESAEAIYQRTAHLVKSLDELTRALEEILKKGGVEAKEKDGKTLYCNAPLVVGMYEFQLNRLTPEFLDVFDTYTNDMKFGLEFLSTKLPQMRTIPVSKSIIPQYNVSTFDEAVALIDESKGPFVIVECICRKKKAMEGSPCKLTERKETCMAIGDMARISMKVGAGREIDKQEAKFILERNQEEGMVLQPSNSQKAEFICSCCGCCCGLLGVFQKLPKPLDFWASNYQAEVDAEDCVGCGICEKQCPVGAIAVSSKTNLAKVDLNLCLGCGQCTTVCPNEALSLVKKQVEVKPPETREELFEVIMAHKKGRLGKLKLTGKLLWDAYTTGRKQLLR